MVSKSKFKDYTHYDCAKDHNVTDLLIFRFDIVHGVSPDLDNHTEFIWDKNKWTDNKGNIFYPKQDNIEGRWVAILIELF